MKRIYFLILLLCAIPQWTFAAPNPDLILRYVNEERAKEGLVLLKVNTQLEQAAAVKAKEIANLGYLIHTTSDALTPWGVMKQVGYTYAKVGENLSLGYPTAREIVDSWLQSSTHRNNILEPSFEELGFASAKGNSGGDSVDYGVLYFGVQKKTENPNISHVTTLQGDAEKEALIRLVSLLQELLRVLLAQQS